MPQQTSPFLSAAYGWALGESNWNLGMDENLLKFSYMFDRNIDGVVTSLPAPVNGEAYFNTTDNRIYYVVNGVFSSTPTPKWFIVTLRPTGEMYQYNGTTLILYKIVANQINYLQGGTGAVGQPIQEVLRKNVLVTDFMSDAQRADALTGTPTIDSSPAFTDFFVQVIVNGGRGRIPKGTYKLDSNVLGDWSQVIEYDEGVAFTGTGILFAIQQVINKTTDSRISRRGATNSGSGVEAVDDYVRLTNVGTGPGYGHRQDYIHTAQLAGGFSLGKGNICLWSDIINGASGQASWAVATTPTLASGGSWGVVVEEMNVMNRGPDTGYVKTRGQSSRWSGGLQVVPEANDLAGGTGNICRNSVFGFCTAHSTGTNNLGLTVKTYNGLLVEKDSIAYLGRGALLSGDSSGIGTNLPEHAIEIDQRWSSGINMVSATFNGNSAIQLGDSHLITWGVTGPTVTGSQSSGVLRLASSGTGAVSIVPGGAVTAIQFVPVSNSVNFFSANPNTTGVAPTFAVVGADTDIAMQLNAKGAGRVQVGVGDLAVNTAGKGLRVKEGANAKQGVATLVAGSVVVANTSITANSRIFLTGQQDGGTAGFTRVSARVVGVSFTITSSSVTDTSIIAYEIFEPA